MSRADTQHIDTVADAPARPGIRTFWRAASSPLLFLALIASWELAVRIFRIEPLLLPAPSAVAASLYGGLSSMLLVRHFGVTLFETAAGFALGAFGGLLLGGLIAQSARLERLLYPYVIAFQTIPKVAVAPLIVIWFGYGMSSKVVIAATIAFFPVLANTIVGLRAVPADQLELMKAFMATRSQILWKVRVPQALPYILVGLDVAAVLAVIGAVVGEFVSAKEGLGFYILQAGFALDTAGVFAALVLLALMGIAIHLAMRALRRRLLYWMRDEETINFNG
jgi:NitT/TauT family transport system permease protein